ncbi:MAG: ATP-binding cassette domain-containing protein [Gammaproteobacteria bacterium]
MLEVASLSAGYGGITVLQDISFGVAHGQILGVLGRNGMGKSTLIRCLAGLIIPSQGRIALDGADITRLPPHERARRGLHHREQGRVPSCSRCAGELEKAASPGQREGRPPR